MGYVTSRRFLQSSITKAVLLPNWSAERDIASRRRAVLTSSFKGIMLLNVACVCVLVLTTTIIKQEGNATASFSLRIDEDNSECSVIW
jgi:hypothetical protein